MIPSFARSESGARARGASAAVSNQSSDYKRISADVKLGRDVQIFAFVNLYGCEIGDETKIGTFVEIQKGAQIGDRCKISSHTFICEGVTIESEVFIGHGVTFINDRYPRATSALGAASDRSGLVLPEHAGQARRFDRFRRDAAWVASPSERTPSSAPAASSPRMCLRTPLSRAIPHES